MAKTKTPKTKPVDEELNDTSSSQEQTPPKDGSDSQRRKQQLTQDDSYIEIPDVSDIPGQEGIVNAGVPGAMKDTTASSDDEEGVKAGRDIFNAEDDEDVKIVMGTEADVTEEDLEMLGDPDQDQDMNEDEFIDKQGLDNTDFDGDPLNEASVSEVSSGDDLDVPEEREDDPKKTEDDEENDYYSLGGPDNDALEEEKD
ncbi:hypothetical protein A4D02_06330 [Niastella koreensis]|uniref:Uncharacterized protein n=2 Tax=Niastella koreensis TaxID=354356 RepID=G8TG12_NIAKG|nr:hypothetical protein [Niastella koreensis]AEW01615.1 hypothetical protein Niako_5378 [Niastella koreensis GR20-10]OQP48330.1 hypothetical protein A4D02_06330 [Niastella koreensis]